MRSVFDSFFIPAQRPPFPYGKSSFRVRGGTYINDLARLEPLIPGGVAAALKAARDPALEAFFAQRFTPTAWYDFVPVVPFTTAIARARRMPYAQLLRENAIHHAARALGGFTGIVLKMLTNEAIAGWLPRVSSTYHDFGTNDSRVAAPGVLRGVRAGVPHYFVLTLAILSTEFIEEILRRCGAADARVHALGAEQDGTRDGLDLFRVEYELRWRP